MGVSYNPSIVTDGLVLCLDAANRRSYPGTGTTWADLSGNGNNGTLINGPTFSSNNGGSISCDGANDNIDTPLDMTQAKKMTVILTFKYLNSNYSDRGILESGSGPSGRRAFRFNSNGINQASWYLSNTGPVLNEYIEQNKTYQVALTWDLFTYKSYSNGVLTNTANYTSWGWAGYNNNLRIGQNYWNSSIEVYSVLYYNVKFLSDDQIKQNFNATRGRYGI